MLNSASGAITGAIREVKGLPPQAPKAAVGHIFIAACESDDLRG